MIKLKMKKVKYDIDREVAKILVISSEKIDKYEYLTDEEILPSDQSRIIEQGKFAHSSLGKTFEKQIKVIENKQGNKLKLRVLKLEENREGTKSIEGLYFKRYEN